jgi:hypothetical protein
MSLILKSVAQNRRGRCPGVDGTFIRRLEVGGWRLEVGGWKLEVGGWKLEIRFGAWNLGIGSFAEARLLSLRFYRVLWIIGLTL